MARPTLRERIQLKTAVNADGCWMWTGCTQTNGYGLIGTGGRSRTMLVHRAAYIEWKGEIPEGMQIDHVCHTEDPNCPGGKTCRHRRCANPDHLEVVTQEENMRRAGPAYCGRGHRLTNRRSRDCAICKPIIAAITARMDEDPDWDDIEQMWFELEQKALAAL